MTKKDRFKGFMWNELNSANTAFPVSEVTVIGAGGIGSYLTFLLSRMDRFNIKLFDADTFDLTNLGGQLLTGDLIGLNKSFAISSLCSELNEDDTNKSTYDVDPTGVHWRVGDDINPITFCCPDSIKVRSDAFEAWCKLEDKMIFVDSRMLGEYYEIFMVTPDKIDEYKKSLFEEGESFSQGLCSQKATSHTGARLASDIIFLFNNWSNNIIMGEGEIYPVPFYIEFNGASFATNTSNTFE